MSRGRSLAAVCSTLLVGLLINGLALEKLTDPDAVPDALYGDMLVLVFRAFAALARESLSAADPAASSSQAAASDETGSENG